MAEFDFGLNRNRTRKREREGVVRGGWEYRLLLLETRDTHTYGGVIYLHTCSSYPS